MEKYGLYKSEYEHDACGIGGIASIDGIKTHKLIEDALDILIHLEHRGGTGVESNSGDGAGILFQIPHEFFKELDLGFKLPDSFQYGVAQVFFSNNQDLYEEELALFLKTLEETNLKLLGIRTVPFSSSAIGNEALSCMPKIIQLFIEKPSNESNTDFERHLYYTRRQIEKRALEKNYKAMYICSMSSKTIVYKGMLVSTQVKHFYSDLNDLRLKSAIATVHSRFSTNTFPSWSRAHPYRYICHNGEINTIKGNVNGIKAREGLLESDVFKDKLQNLFPIIANQSSDSAMLDNVIEFLIMNGRSLEEAVSFLIPEAWSKNINDSKLRAYYEFNSTCTEPWDGPAAIIFTDGEKLGVTLDRNGLRPARYTITKDNYFIVYSETGSLLLNDKDLKQKSRLNAGEMILVDTVSKHFYNNKEIKEALSSQRPYEEYIKNIVKIKPSRDISTTKLKDEDFNYILNEYKYKQDDINNSILYMAKNKQDKVVAMGKETPIAVLSKNIPLLYDFFMQNFAQVTNPPIDSIREYNITSERIYVGREGNLIKPSENNTKRIRLKSPIISINELESIKKLKSFKCVDLDITYSTETKLKDALDSLFKKALNEINNGVDILILNDENIINKRLAIPSLLALSGIHAYLTKKSKRTHASIIVNTYEPREIHHFACLIGYGATAVCPKMSFNIINEYSTKINVAFEDLEKNYIEASTKGIVKIMSKMGISTIQSYNGAQIFEALGLSKKLIDTYFPGTTSSIGGIDLEDIEQEILKHHNNVLKNIKEEDEDKIFDKETISYLQESTLKNDYELFKKYSDRVNSKLINISDLFDFNYSNSIPIENVESIDEIVKRFSTGAMSLGAISSEAHEALAEAMNTLHAMSNSGEGGEIKERYNTILNSNIKQVASARFGVDILYLNSAKEIQIKVAQGAKPGEGGNLPKNKVYPHIAKARHATQGVSLISPPPHHDIYSIEDLAQLIYDLKCANPNAIISVKLVSEAGVGTVASGVVKAGANKILISGFNGGTGAASSSSILHAGMPYEIGLAETHQTLILNNLRQLVKIEADGKMLTGKNVIIAAILGADLFSFSTAPLIVLGCRMLKVCNLNTCPFGVATQDEKLRQKFKGKSEYVINFMRFIAREVREILAKLGFKRLEDLIGHINCLKAKKVRKIDLSNVLYKMDTINKTTYHFEHIKENSVYKTLDYETIIPLIKNNLENKLKSNISLSITNTNRAVGTYLSHYLISKNINLLDNSITINCYGNAGNSFGAFLNKGITLNVIGDTNDYLAKGLSGGIISVRNDPNFTADITKNIIAGNVILYGATCGEVYIDGVCGERFAVRLSGAKAVVLGVGNHGGEYMTGGILLVLDKIGKNFLSGASGGIIYVRNYKENLENINYTSVKVYETNEIDLKDIKDLLNKHISYTNSIYAKNLLENLTNNTFIKIIPNEYYHMQELLKKHNNNELEAFKELIK